MKCVFLLLAFAIAFVSVSEAKKKASRPDNKGTHCTDLSIHCSDWARHGRCVRDAAYMGINCKKSCRWCPEYCYTGNGEDYIGTKSTTKSGYTCQRWDTQSPHKHSYGHINAENYCRNPSSHTEPWCYTDDAKKRWENCDAPKCGEVKCFQQNMVYTIPKLGIPLDLAAGPKNWAVVFKRVGSPKACQSICQAFDYPGKGCNYWSYNNEKDAPGWANFGGSCYALNIVGQPELNPSLNQWTSGPVEC